MKKSVRFILGLFVGLYAMNAGSAEPYERVVLKNGSVLEGYISAQFLGKNILFMAERANVYIPQENIERISYDERELAGLTDEWKEWAKVNPQAVLKRDNKEFITLSSISLQYVPSKMPETADKGKSGNSGKESDKDSVAVRKDKEPVKINWGVVPVNVRILEKGSVVKYLDYSDITYDINWNDVVMIQRDQRNKLDLTGVVDVIEMKSGVFVEGQIIEQTPDSGIKVMKDDGMVEVIPMNKVKSQKRRKLNPDMSLYEQSPLIETVVRQNGEQFSGIIIEQKLAEKNEAGYIIISNERGDITRIDSKDVKEIRKSRNAGYKQITDIIVGDNEVWINRTKAENAKIINDKGYFIVDKESKFIKLSARKNNSQIVVEQKNSTSGKGIILIKIVPKEIKGYGLSNAFTYESLVNNSIQAAECTVSVNNTLKHVYNVSPGDYILYNQHNKNSIFIKMAN